MGATAVQTTSRRVSQPVQLVKATTPFGRKHFKHVAKKPRLQRKCCRAPCTVAAAVPVTSTTAPKTSLLFSVVEKLFNFPPIYAAAVKQVS